MGGGNGYSRWREGEKKEGKAKASAALVQLVFQALCFTEAWFALKKNKSTSLPKPANGSGRQTQESCGCLPSVPGSPAEFIWTEQPFQRGLSVGVWGEGLLGRPSWSTATTLHPLLCCQTPGRSSHSLLSLCVLYMTQFHPLFKPGGRLSWQSPDIASPQF